MDKEMQGSDGCGGKCSGCECHGMCGGMHGRHGRGHWIIKILIAVLIFWAGMQYGELRGMLRSGQYGYGMMGIRNGGNVGYYGGGPGMMGYVSYGSASQATSTPIQ